MMVRPFVNWLRTLGAPEDPVATDTTSAWSAMSLLKAIYGQIAGGGLQAGLVAALSATSSTSATIGTGEQTLDIETGKAFSVGQWVNIASEADPNNFMNGPVAGHDSATGTLIVDVDNIGGSGTHSDWVISLSGTQGPAATIEIGTVTDLDPGVAPTVANSGTATHATFDFGLPVTPTIEIGVVTGVGPNDPPTVTNVGDARDIILNIELPQGQPGADGANGVDGEMSGPGASIDGEIALFNGTSGATLKRSNHTGILKATDGVLASASAGTDYLAPAAIGVTVQAYDADTLKADTDDTLTAGFDATPVNDGTKTTGTYTPTFAGGNIKTAVNGGAHTLAPPTGSGTIIIQYTNNGSAGAITTSGFTKVDGSFTTANGDDFLACITKVGSFSHLNIVKLQ